MSNQPRMLTGATRFRISFLGRFVLEVEETITTRDDERAVAIWRDARITDYIRLKGIRPDLFLDCVPADAVDEIRREIYGVLTSPPPSPPKPKQ